MSYPYGNNIKIYIDGGSHDERMKLRIENFPCGMKVDCEKLSSFLSRRAPGRDSYSTMRKESDEPIFLSGIERGVTTGGIIDAEIVNKNQRSQDYSFSDTPRPSHADLAAVMKYGKDVDLRGGGHFSGRLTAMMCIAGGLAKQYLSERGIEVFAHIYSVGKIKDIPFSLTDAGEKEQAILNKKAFPVLSDAAEELIKGEILSAKAELDSVGGICECAIVGLPYGLGEHMFAGAEGRISSAVFSVPAVKGIEFGRGFETAFLKGSENNDPFVTDGKKIYTKTNNAGGILGGMTTAMPIVFRCAIKPTPSIGKEQDTVSISKMENVRITVGGRHDPCILPRAVPVIEAAAALAILDMLLDK